MPWRLPVSPADHEGASPCWLWSNGAFLQSAIVGAKVTPDAIAVVSRCGVPSLAMTTLPARTRLLMVEDTVSLADAYAAYLRDEPYEIKHVETAQEAMAALADNPPEAMLLDLMLPDRPGLEILKEVSDRKIPCAVVVATAHGSINVAVEAMRLGAADFLVKPFTAERLAITLRNAVERQRLSRIVEIYKREFDRREFGGFIGATLPMQAVYRIIDSAAASKATVFIMGESGTGKELCAEAVHQRSPRADGPFVPINCAAIPKDLMESEIFGHVRGAFTGAVADRTGAAGLADGGTLFLDEICDLDHALQAKLLRFLQTGSFQKVGSSRTERVDVRIVCASNRDPLAEVEAGRFREDLYYRLHVIPITMPPLRERQDDIVLIARKFLADAAREEGKRFQSLAPDAERILSAYTWPGNVRQLQNVIRNSVVLHDGEVLVPEMLPSPLATAGARPLLRRSVTTAVPAESKTLASQTIRPLADVERETIERAIEICEGNIPKAAAELGVSASTLYRKRETWLRQETDK